MKPVDRLAAGNFLVASPLLSDPNFTRTVVLMCEVGEGGAWGLVVNRRTALTFGEILNDLPFPAGAGGPVMWGGPCETSRMQVLHNLRRDTEALDLGPDLRLGLEPDLFREVVAEPRLPGEFLHAYVGHAGWGAGQLDAEIEEGSWITCTGDSLIVFDTDPDAAWERVLSSLGPAHARLASYPPNVREN